MPRWVRWQKAPGDQRAYWLGRGTLAPRQVPTWTLMVMDGPEVTDSTSWEPPPSSTSREELQDWLVPMTGPEAARTLVTGMAEALPDLFTDPSPPRSG